MGSQSMSFKFRIKKGSTDPARHDRGVCKGQFMHCGSTRHCFYGCINVYSLEAVTGRGQAGRNSFDVPKDLDNYGAH